ncbi:NlpC/P60 family protein [Brevibacillus laterosporus]|uniref:NlpC/P60 family protein n=1 Tax=Brevibacillus laterosporus TaxID=1465 RepID=A0A502H887_BRELA|nr:NlpC/P60 family protein [Brevibacillus laterosporus]QDX92617.1 NlpC/P60 family protein [Brevibacillus laterosporus]TPG70929.1 NlpC/P60 family protein [Brevibacillus laterosporus]TPG93214.1 NlpC/P60 family protein [Brevibacillus laterosporus]
MRKFVCSILMTALLAVGGGSVFASSNSLGDTINSLYGVPYKAAGKSTSGFDCSGFTGYVFSSLGTKLPASSASQFDMGESVDREDLKPGDLVFFNTNGTNISHVGIYIGNNMFAHSETGIGVTKTSLDDPYYWSKRYVGAKRVAIADLED